MPRPVRPYGASAAALVLLAVDLLVRAGRRAVRTSARPSSCSRPAGLRCFPFLPAALRSPSRQLAVLPALALASLSILLSTISIVGIELTEVTIRLAARLVFVLAMAAATTMLRSRTDGGSGSAWSVAARRSRSPFSPRCSSSRTRRRSTSHARSCAGADLGHYLLYADEVEAQGSAPDRRSVRGRAGSDLRRPAAVGAVYGTFLILDGISSWPLAHGLARRIARSPCSVCSRPLPRCGERAPAWPLQAPTAVAPIRLDPMYWHGLGTTLALVFVPLVVLALGLMYRGPGDRRAIGAPRPVARRGGVPHSTSMIVVVR